MSPALELRGVSKSFGRTPVLRHLSLAVAAGERLALIGPNGAGKTTLFDLASGRLAPDAGQVVLQGRRIDGLAPHRVQRAGLGRSHQVSQLFAQLSVAEHLHCALLRGRHGWRWPAMQDELAHWLDRLALAHRADVVAGELSYADQRTLEIGLAAAGGAPVLLLDEPTAGMSAAETARCVALVRALSAGRTLVVIEHDMGVVFELAHRIAVLVDGAVIALDTPARVRANPQVQQAYLGTALV